MSESISYPSPPSPPLVLVVHCSVYHCHCSWGNFKVVLIFVSLIILVHHFWRYFLAIFFFSWELCFYVTGLIFELIPFVSFMPTSGEVSPLYFFFPFTLSNICDIHVHLCVCVHMHSCEACSLMTRITFYLSPTLLTETVSQITPDLSDMVNLPPQLTLRISYLPNTRRTAGPPHPRSFFLGSGDADAITLVWQVN